MYFYQSKKKYYRFPSKSKYLDYDSRLSYYFPDYSHSTSDNFMDRSFDEDDIDLENQKNHSH